MSTASSADQSVVETVEINLREPGVAAFWAWFWPGAGHIYQGRYAKGSLFMICILGTYFYGLVLGGGRVVYAYWERGEQRYHYLCQVGVGLPALPAVVQNMRVGQGKEPLFGGIMAPPPGQNRALREESLSGWHHYYGWRFEMGTLFTMVAGLLNVLAIYDAYAGPALPVPEDEKKSDKPPGKKGKDKGKKGS
jgi:hypothetical protein